MDCKLGYDPTAALDSSRISALRRQPSLSVGASPTYQRRLTGRAPDDSDGVEVRRLPLVPVFGIQTRNTARRKGSACVINPGFPLGLAGLSLGVDDVTHYPLRAVSS